MVSSLQGIWFLFTAILVQDATTQSLSERLLAEDPVQLATEARRDGDIVRGAILFHQGTINCAKCHRPKAAADRLGPDLSRLDQNVDDGHLVESILQPSKVISEGFETTNVLITRGQLINGLVVEKDENVLVIRAGQEPDRLITIELDDVEDLGPGQKSSMPDNLADELKNRQQFLDLVRYVIDIKERGPEHIVGAAQTERTIALSPELHGLKLIANLNCVACHDTGTKGSIVAAKQAPQLRWSGKNLNPAFMEKFIADPGGVKPVTSMPDVFARLTPSDRRRIAQAITHYLVSVTGNGFQFEIPEHEAVRRGRELFHAVGCVACHSPRDAKARETTLPDSIPLGSLTEKYNVTALTEFLTDPLAVRSSGHMPNMTLSHREAVDISSFLLQSDRGVASPWELDTKLAQEGKTLFLEHDCARCHTDVFREPPEFDEYTLFSELNPERGCLSGETGAWPDFQLPPSDRQSIQAALNALPFSLSPEQQIQVTLQYFNCVACHDRNGFGGVTAERNPHFQTTDLNLGDQGRIPPTLSGVGAKLKPEWMRDVLVNRRTIRPYMKTRMPQFGEENIGHLLTLFEETDRLPATKFAVFEDQKETRQHGLFLAGNQGLNCVACHTYKYKLSDTMPAVDLTEMAERLEKDWFYHYMLAPQRFSPNTVMPSFWPGGVAMRPDIPGTPEDQIEALWQYLIDGRQAGTPRGVVREPLQIVVTDEARMLRRKYPGIGKRGIGVGYPGGVNLAFDAEQMRLGSIWKGKFVDPAGVWTGQGSGEVRPLGKTVVFPSGPEFDDLASPWVVDDGRPGDHQFKGYSLDQLQRPTFRYQFESFVIEDAFREFADKSTEQTQLRRTVTMSTQAERKNVRFRIESGAEISAEPNRTFSIDDQLRIRLVSQHQARIVEYESDRLLIIPLDFAAGQTQQIVFEYLWE